MNSLGIMLGRLSPPINSMIQSFPSKTWRNEFQLANKLGFDLIEWIYDLSENNPIISQDPNELKKLSLENDIKIDSVCADYFMEKRLFNVSTFELSSNLDKLKQLIRNCNKLEIKILEIPLVDSSSIQNDAFRRELVSNLNSIIPLAEDNQVYLTLETDLPPELFCNLLEEFNHPNIMANYDIGNSVSLGYDPSVELTTISKWIKNIHVKDRLYNSGTVPLGSGNVDFELFFALLSKINFSNSLIIQGAREDLVKHQISPEETCSKYLKFVKQYMSKYLA